MKSKKFAIYVKKNLVLIKNTVKLQIIVIIQENLEELPIVFVICVTKYLKRFSVVFHNGSTYDYHFIIEQVAKEFKGNFDCLGENTEKYITFSAPIYKKNDNDETVIYKLKFIDNFRFMSASLSSVVDNLSEINKKESLNELIEKFPNTY